jgi:hypothetical protein
VVLVDVLDPSSHHNFIQSVIVVLADVLDPSSHCVVSLNGYVRHSCKVGFKMVFQKHFKMFLIVSYLFFKNVLKNGLKTINVHVNYHSKFSQQQLNICLTEEG